jgi:hypothetical protein
MSDARTTEISQQLDEHHAPETNGRMAVCRRCGSHTDSPVGSHHATAEHQLDRSADWLTGQARITHIDEVRKARGSVTP